MQTHYFNASHAALIDPRQLFQARPAAPPQRQAIPAAPATTSQANFSRVSHLLDQLNLRPTSRSHGSVTGSTAFFQYATDPVSTSFHSTNSGCSQPGSGCSKNIDTHPGPPGTSRFTSDSSPCICQTGIGSKHRTATHYCR